MQNPEQQGRRAPEDAERLAWAVVRAADRAVAEHASNCPARRDVEMPAPIPLRVLAEIVAWLGAQWVDTHVWDVEAAAARFDVPTQVLWPELARYFRNRANGGWRR